MPRASGIKQLLSPVAGLVTEQSKLTPVEGSTVDEVNFTYNDSGSMRQRRLGLNKEDGADFFSLPDAITDTNATSYALWSAVGGTGSLNFHVFQIGSTLYFIKDTSGDLTNERQVFTFDLDTAVAPAFTTVETEPVDMIAGDGKLFVVGRKIKPFYLEYDSAGPTVTSAYVDINIRDMTGLDDTYAVDERPATLSENHDYNLNNQGWWQTRRIVAAGSFVDPIAQFNTTNGAYPSNADIALLGMVDDGDGNLVYDPDYLLELTLGNTPAPKGHFILDPFNIDYESLRTGTGGSGGYGGTSGSLSDADVSGVVSNHVWWRDALVDSEWGT